MKIEVRGIARDPRFRAAAVQQLTVLREAIQACRKGGLELQGFVHRLVHEALDRLLTPGLERRLAEPAPEALDPGEPDAVDLAALPVAPGLGARSPFLAHRAGRPGGRPAHRSVTPVTSEGS